jgi:hypothetical protein
MAISNVNAQRQNPYTLTQPHTNRASSVVTKFKSGGELGAELVPNNTQQVNLQTDAKSIMAKYDLTHITYGDMAKLGKELVDAGALPENKLLDFIPLEPGRISIDGTVRESSNEPVNMIERQQDILASIKTFGGKGADYAMGVLNMYKNFQTLAANANFKHRE